MAGGTHHVPDAAEVRRYMKHYREGHQAVSLRGSVGASAWPRCTPSIQGRQAFAYASLSSLSHTVHTNLSPMRGADAHLIETSSLCSGGQRSPCWGEQRPPLLLRGSTTSPLCSGGQRSPCWGEQRPLLLLRGSSTSSVLGRVVLPRDAEGGGQVGEGSEGGQTGQI